MDQYQLFKQGSHMLRRHFLLTTVIITIKRKHKQLIVFKPSHSSVVLFMFERHEAKLKYNGLKVSLKYITDFLVFQKYSFLDIFF